MGTPADFVERCWNDASVLDEMPYLVARREVFGVPWRQNRCGVIPGIEGRASWSGGSFNLSDRMLEQLPKSTSVRLPCQ